MRAWIALAAVAAVSASAQNAPQPPAEGGKVVVSVGRNIDQAVQGWAKAAGVMAAADPDLTGRVSDATSKLPIEQGLTAVAKQYHAQWRKVYLADNEIPKRPDGSVDARRLKRLVMAAQAAPPVSIGIVDPGTGMMTVSSVGAESSAGMQAWAKDRKAVYLLYLPQASTTGAGGPDSMMPPGGMDAFMAMTPEQRQQWMDAHGGVILSSRMSPEERAALMQRLPPELRDRIQKQMEEHPSEGQGEGVMIIKTSPAQ